MYLSLDGGHTHDSQDQFPLASCLTGPPTQSRVPPTTYTGTVSQRCGGVGEAPSGQEAVAGRHPQQVHRLGDRQPLQEGHARQGRQREEAKPWVCLGGGGDRQPDRSTDRPTANPLDPRPTALPSARRLHQEVAQREGYEDEVPGITPRPCRAERSLDLVRCCVFASSSNCGKRRPKSRPGALPKDSARSGGLRCVAATRCASEGVGGVNLCLQQRAYPGPNSVPHPEVLTSVTSFAPVPSTCWRPAPFELELSRKGACAHLC